MRKITALICVLVMCFSCFGAMADTVRIPLSGTVKTIDIAVRNTGHTAQQVDSLTSVAQYFALEEGAELLGMTVCCPSYSDNTGNITLSIYKWAGSVEETIKENAIASETYVDFKDGANLVLNVYGKYTGEFMLYAHNGTQNVGVWFEKSTDYPQQTFVNGVLQENLFLRSSVHVKTPLELVEKDSVHTEVRSAYQKIPAADFDGSQGITVKDIPVSEQESAGAAKLIAGKIGGVARYNRIDFGSTPPKGVIFGIYCGNLCQMQQVHVVLDDPASKPVAVLQYEFDRIDYEWEVYPATITESITGVHDVYLITYGDFDNVQISRFEFTKENLGLSPVERRLEDFNGDALPEYTDTYADTWVATDMLGRKLPGYETAGNFNPDKQVGMFFWNWHVNVGNRLTQTPIINVNEMVERYPEIKNDFYAPQWNGQTLGFVWNESVYGLYSTNDEWVIRKQMELLESAGVDSIFYDTTNGHTYNTGAMKIAKVMHQMHMEGVDTPKFSFIFPFANIEYNTLNLRNLYEVMYQPGLYSDCWYYWEGKPVLMATPEGLKKATGYGDIDALYNEIRDFFTFRPGQGEYRRGPQKENDWPWLEVYPQHPYGESEKYGCEAVSVGIAQNCNDESRLVAMNGEGVYGRSYTYKNRYSLLNEDSKYYGYNFLEQWERAFELDPEFVFVTGWNEYRMGRNKVWNGTVNAFPDQFNDEYSRDIEPSRGDLKDVYYYQLVSNIRKFKGVRPTPVAGAEKTIKFSSGFEQWNDVKPDFIGIKGGTEERKEKGYEGKLYTNTTGRNDIVLSKVSRDDKYLYFYVKTSENLTPHTDSSWMRLFINTDRTYKTGWEGYDFAVNITPPSKKTSATLSYSADGWNWKNVGTLTYFYSGKQMMIRIPREMIGLEGKLVDIEFKWIDNMQNDGDIMDVYVSGDSAPIGRFAYRYTETARYDKTPVDEPVTVSQLKTNQYKHSVIMAIDNSTVFVGGRQVNVDVAPQIINDKTMIPLRFFSESFGAEVDWNENTKTATVTLDGNTVQVVVGKSEMLANGEKVTLESPAVIQNGRTLVPMRNLTENLGKQVLWIDGGLIIAGTNPETVHSCEWVGDITEKTYGLR